MRVKQRAVAAAAAARKENDPWCRSWYAASKRVSATACAGARPGTAAAWRRRCAISCGRRPPRRMLRPPSASARASPAASLASDRRTASRSCADTRHGRRTSGSDRAVILLDTNVLSALIRAAPDPRVVAWLDRQPPEAIWTTSVTVFEVEFGLALLPDGRRRRALEAAFRLVLREDLSGRVAAF